MKPRGVRGISFTGWIILVIIILAVETCLLGVIAGVFLLQRGSLNLPVKSTIVALPVLSQTQESGAVLIPTDTPAESGVASSPIPPGSTDTLPNIPTTVGQPEASPTAWEFPPSGKIVYVCFDGKHDQICLMDPTGAQKIQLTDVEATNFYPSLSPDGNLIIFSSNRDGNFELYTMDLSGGNIQKLTDNIGNLYAPEISPNGNRVVFTHETGGNQDIWLMRSDGGNARSLTDTGNNIDPIWSPNGEQIAFTSSRNGVNQLFIMNANGNNQHPVTITDTPKIGGRISWSPDGQWLAFYAGNTGNHNIYRVMIDGGQLTQLTAGGDNLAPSYSPDGAWLAFTSYRDGNNEVYIIQQDGTNPNRLTRSPTSDWQPRWGR